jgi:hypothetical protein
VDILSVPIITSRNIIIVMDITTMSRGITGCIAVIAGANYPACPTNATDAV